MDTITLLGTATGLGLVAGFRLYATTLVLGLAVRFGWIDLAPQYSQLSVLASDWMLALSGLAFVLEFVADKIPWLDTLWDAVHTFIRPLGAALVAVSAAGSLNPAAQTALFLLAGGVAFTGHTAKAGTRVLANHSPEPVSNIALSLTEDVLAGTGIWLAFAHPAIMLGAVLVFLAAFAWLSPKLIRLVRFQLAALAALLRSWTADSTGLPDSGFMRAVAANGAAGLKNSIGSIVLHPDALEYSARRWFGERRHRIPLSSISEVAFRRRILVDELTLHCGRGEQRYYFFKDSRRANEELFQAMVRAGCPVRDRKPRDWAPTGAQVRP